MAELDVKERQAGDVTILDMNGEVRIGEGSIALRDAIRNLVSRRQEEDFAQSSRGQLHRLERHR